MAILQQPVTSMSAGGFNKSIEASAHDMLLELFQSRQYSTPVKSTVREIASNCVDSIKERETAREILINKKPVTDFFEDIEGELFKDSKFDPDYYDFKWLSSDSSVYIRFIQSETQNYAEFEDFGVGLGKYRLEKYFSIGYSTKRLSKIPLGKFGLGAKAPLSVNSFYTMESRYNGQLFRFNIFNKDVQSIIPKFNLETGAENPFILLHGEPVYYETTDKLNGVKVTIPVKKHHFTEFDEGVKKQLMYFDNIKYTVKDEYNNLSVIPVHPTILYQDDYLVISDNKYFSRPHILINKVNYGFINFDELELQEARGNIGIKVSPEEVEVSPSRENLIWEEKTKKAVLQRFKDAQTAASNLVTATVSTEKDFIGWLNVVRTIISKWSRTASDQHTALHVLSNLVDADSLNLTFPLKYNPDEKSAHLVFKFSHKVFDELDIKVNSVTFVRATVKNKLVQKIERNSSIDVFENVYLVTTKVSNKKDKYLLSMFPSIVLIYLPAAFINTEYTGREHIFDNAVINTNHREMQRAVIEEILASKYVKIYEDVEVPADWKSTEEEEETIAVESLSKEEIEKADVSASLRRKISGNILLHRVAHASFYKEETAISTISTWNNEEIYWGTDNDAGLLHIVYEIMSEFSGNTFDNISPVRLFKLSNENSKYVRDFQHIQKFFAQNKNGCITMSNYLVQWNTARAIIPKMHLLNFMQGLEQIPELTDKYQDYLKVYDYVKPFINLDEFPPESISRITAHLDKVAQFQRIVHEGATKEEIAEIATQMWGSSQITDGCALNLDILRIFEELIDWSTSIRNLLNCCKILTSSSNRTEFDYCLSYDEGTLEELEAVLNYITIKT
jgi:hypothetical protein